MAARDLRDDRDRWASDTCSVSRALAIVGTRSAMLLLREAFFGTRRFDDFARRVGITEAVAATRLHELLDAGLLVKVPYREPGQRSRLEYRLTTMGRELQPVIIALMLWGDRWLADPDGPPVELSHRDCGEPVELRIGCAAGHRLTDRDILVSPRPGAREVGARHTTAVSSSRGRS